MRSGSGACLPCGVLLVSSFYWFCCISVFVCLYLMFFICFCVIPERSVMVYSHFLGVSCFIGSWLNLTECFGHIVYGTMSVMLFVWLFVCYFSVFLLLFPVFFILSFALFQRSVMVYSHFLGVSCFIGSWLNLTECFGHIVYISGPKRVQ